jgi:hypothetical protein
MKSLLGKIEPTEKKSKEQVQSVPGIDTKSNSLVDQKALITSFFKHKSESATNARSETSGKSASQPPRAPMFALTLA